MRIAVLMSVYKNDNKADLEVAVNSVLAQTFKEFDLHIQCDGSIAEECKKYLLSIKDKRVFVYERSENHGLAYSLNELLARVIKMDYDFFARMDADDICFEDRFEKQILFIEENKLDIVGGQIIEFGKDTSEIVSERIVPCTHEEIVALMKVRSPFSHPTILIRKKVIEVIKGYSYTIFPEDYDFFVRAYMNGFKFGNLPDKVLWFRLGADLSAAIKRRWGWKYAKNEYKLYRNFLRIGYYSIVDFIKVILIKIPLRLVPFKVFKFIYYKLSR